MMYVTDELGKLYALKKKGVITGKEYKSLKEKILADAGVYREFSRNFSIADTQTNRAIRIHFILSTFAFSLLFVVSSVSLSASSVRHPGLTSMKESTDTYAENNNTISINISNQADHGIFNFLNPFSGTASGSMWSEHSISNGVDEMLKNLLSMRFLFHGLCFLGTTAWYTKLRNSFLETLVFMVYINLFIQVTIAAILRSNDERFSTKPYMLYAYSACMFYSGIWLIIFHKFSKKISLVEPRSVILDAETIEKKNMATIDEEEHIDNKTCTAPTETIQDNRFSNSSTYFLLALKYIQILEICRSAALVYTFYAEESEMELINESIHSSILPTFGWYAWSSIGNQRMNANAALWVYVWKLVLTLSIRISSLLEAKSNDGAESNLHTALGLFLCFVGLIVSFSLYRNTLVSNSSTKKPWYWVYLYEKFEATNNGSYESVGDKTRQSALFDVRISICPCVNKRDKSLFFAAISVAAFSLLWLLEAVILSMSQMWFGTAFLLSITSLNAAGHAAAIFGMQFYAIDYRLKDLMAARKRFVLSVNLVFLILSSVQWYSNKFLFSRVIAFGRVCCCLTAISSMMIFQCIGSRTTDSDISYSVVDNHSNKDLSNQIFKYKVRVIISVATTMASFVLLGISVFLASPNLRPGMSVKYVGEILFHFAFLLPILSWTGVKFNHRLNIAYSVLGNISVSCVCFTIALIEFCYSVSIMYAFCFALSSITSGICAVSLYTLRRTLIRAQVPQGDIVWRIEDHN
mmetsp:Transcript_1143/g.1694  ORF Transcript_1143/g.1694 Transcript_1143/m.1694 type:complete len:750 (-) Transcript_1143:189-2438(-)